MNIIETTLAKSLNINIEQVTTTIKLLDQGATIPFIARYRKEKTNGLTDIQLRHLQQQLEQLRHLEQRKTTIINSIKRQGRLTKELVNRINQATTAIALEDLYLPYKPQRKDKALLAHKAGLSPLAQQISQQTNSSLEDLASPFIQPEKNINSTAEALSGAQLILMKHWNEDYLLREQLRHLLLNQGSLIVSVKPDKKEKGSKYKDYFNHQEKLKTIPSHRVLAIFRGKQEKILDIALEILSPSDPQPFSYEEVITKFYKLDPDKPLFSWLLETAKKCWQLRIKPKIVTELLKQLKQRAEQDAVITFQKNLQDILLASPAGQKIILGIDPGLRTGVKLSVINQTGTPLIHETIYPHAPKNNWQQSIDCLKNLCDQYHVELIALGNGTASRETGTLLTELKSQYPELAKIPNIIVSEAGASVYSASTVAAKEFPDLDVCYRSSISIARRLQDPLSELVKIEPKSIGVGQYQHDINSKLLTTALHATVESCVNQVGVNVNTASAQLLSYVAGLNPTIANNLIRYKESHGPFTQREQLKSIPRFGNKTFEQAAGFLRITGGEQPLDATAIHPESYSFISEIVDLYQVTTEELIGNTEIVNQLSIQDFSGSQFGPATISDIINELKNPAKDPRPEFNSVSFTAAVTDFKHLSIGMILPGVITNVTDFGAFVDVGVHINGLVHISELAPFYVSNPTKLVKAGDIVKVRVLLLDESRKRIQLSLNLKQPTKENQNTTKTKQQKFSAKSNKASTKKQNKPQQSFGTFADLFNQAKPLRRCRKTP